MFSPPPGTHTYNGPAWLYLIRLRGRLLLMYRLSKALHLISIEQEIHDEVLRDPEQHLTPGGRREERRVSEKRQSRK